MKKQLTFLLFLCLSMDLSSVWAQASAQDWINFNQSYYKVTTASTGIHRITESQLRDLGVPVQTIDPRSLQLFHRGTELAIFVQGQNDGSFDESDFIEFYGRRNDGQSNAALYMSPELQPHTYFNLYTDTTAYFLTWRLDGTQGKRMQQIAAQSNTNNLSPIPSFAGEQLLLQTQSSYNGQTYPRSNSTRLSQFDRGEGFSGQNFDMRTARDYTLDNIVNRLSGNATLEVLIQGRNNNAHLIDVSVGASSNGLRAAASVDFNGAEFVKVPIAVTDADFNANGSIAMRLQSRSTISDQVSISYLRLSYPRSVDMNGLSRLTVKLEASNSPRFLRIQNVLSGARLYDVTDANNPIRVGTNLVSGAMQTVLPASAERTLFAEGPGFITPNIKRVQFRNISVLDPNYVIISHRELMKPSANYSDPVKAFAAYRRSAQGGGFDTLVVNSSLLFDQFNYGEPSPQAIFEFVRYIYQKSEPEYLFIVGKGLYWFYRFYRATDPFNNATIPFKDFVPPAGHPGSDALYSMGLGGELNVPAIATGRLNANTPQDVENYLEKIKSMEAQPLNALWRKEHVMLSGGLSSTEIFLFRIYVEAFRSIMENPYLGGQSTLFNKTTNNVVELINIADEVNQGLQMITFFGHSGTQATDVDIGYVSNPINGYNNKDKYPFILVNGCNAGEIFNNQVVTFGEDWIKTRDKGAIGVLAHAAEGFSSELRKYSNLFYQTAFADTLLIDQSMGKVHQEVIRRYIAAEGANFLPLDRAQVQQMILQGDPAYRLFPTNKPDYETTAQQLSVVSFDNEVVTARTDSFGISIVVKNYGRTVDDSLRVQVKRSLPNGDQIVYDPVSYPPVYYTDTLLFVIKENSESYFGRNLFEITLDPFNEVPEINEQNNKAVFEYFLPLSGTQNLYPYRDAVVSETQLKLIAQSTDLFGKNRSYLIEIDTAADFSSPWKQQTVVQSTVLFEWEPNLLTSDSTTYFWRTKFEQPTEFEVDDWSVSAFTYIDNGNEGWLQRKTGQFERERLTGLEVTAMGKLAFKQGEVQLNVTTSRGSESSVTSILVDGLELNTTRPCDLNTLNLVAFDRSSGNPYVVLFQPGQFDALDPLNCGRRPQVINQIRNNELLDTEQFLHRYIDGVEEGDFVLVVTNDSVNLETMVSQSRARLIELGASGTVLDGLVNGQSFIMLGRRGMAEGEAIMVIEPQGRNRPQSVTLETVFQTSFSSGSILSSRIGPSLSWQNFGFNLSEIQAANDVFYANIIGVDAEGNETLLFSFLEEGQDLSGISAEQYPFLRVQLFLEDLVTQTPAQLNRWFVNFTTAPEGIILPDQTFYSEPKEIPEGESFGIPFTYRNIGEKSYDSDLNITATFTNTNTGQQDVVQVQQAAPLPNEQISGSISWDSKRKSGLKDFRLQILPVSGKEQITNNNQFNVNRFVRVLADTLAPVLSVTFDGITIMDGDIVSPSPFINIRMKDENPFLKKQDTTGVELFIAKDCEGCEFERVNLNSSEVRVITATEERDFSVEYQPANLENGRYTLRVNVSDDSNNFSSSEPYTINFEVINESTITHFYPYPNPFSSSTRFVFTLTGAEIPDELKIQIMTITGRVVREILQDEIGPLRIGNNITQYAWDGRDEFGDPLANGVYLYRVFVRINGQFVDQRATSADKAFKKGFGKLYILR